jgi:hypothetical protein
MKTLITVFIVLIFAFFTKYVFSQTETTMQDILEKVTDKVTDLEDKKDQEVVNITIDLLVRTTGKKQVTRYLDPSFDYTVIVLGDRRISRLNLLVYKKTKNDWEYVTEASGAVPQVDITPSDFEQFEFTVNADQFKDTNITGHFALLIYHVDPAKKKDKQK